MRRETKAILGEVLARLLPQLDERQRRLALGAAARGGGYGGIRLVARMAGVAESTVARGARELVVGGQGPGRVRAAGAGRKGLRDRGPGLGGAGGDRAGAASGCETVTRAWSRRCWRWSSRISAVIRSPRCAGPPSRRGTRPRTGPPRAIRSAPIPSPGC